MRWRGRMKGSCEQGGLDIFAGLRNVNLATVNHPCGIGMNTVVPVNSTNAPPLTMVLPLEWIASSVALTMKLPIPSGIGPPLSSPLFVFLQQPC